MDNIRELAVKKIKKNIRFGVKYIPQVKKNRKTGDEETTFKVAIIIKNVDIGVESIHNGFTTYIYERYGKHASTYQGNQSSIITQFLNYIYFNENEELRIANMSDLTIDDISDFLNMKAEEVSNNSLENYKDGIKNFVKYFYYKGVMKNFGKENIDRELEFNDICNGSNINEPMHDMEPALVMLFIHEAIRIAPRIAIGIYFQAFGGVRVSEICNLTYNSIEPIGVNCRDGALLDIRKRTMRPDLRGYDARCGTKNERIQVVYPCGDFQVSLFEEHKKSFKSITSVDAVFVNEAGLPMTNSTYREQFNKVKKSFIKTIETIGTESKKMRFITKADKLSRERWSTHLFRGVFSNMVASHVKTINELMVLRGDKSPKSSLPYLQKSETTKKAIDRTISEEYKNLCGEEQFEKITKAYTLKINERSSKKQR